MLSRVRTRPLKEQPQLRLARVGSQGMGKSSLVCRRGRNASKITDPDKGPQRVARDALLNTSQGSQACLCTVITAFFAAQVSSQHCGKCRAGFSGHTSATGCVAGPAWYGFGLSKLGQRIACLSLIFLILVLESGALRWNLS